MIPVTAIITTRNEELNLDYCLRSLQNLVDEVYVVDSESEDRTVQIARKYNAKVEILPYDHSRIIPWIFQWALDHVDIRNEWVLILEADQIVSEELKAELEALFSQRGVPANGFYVRRVQIFRGKHIRFGGYGRKYLLKLFRKDMGELDELEQDTRVYVRGRVNKLHGPLIEYNRKEEQILFYLQKHIRYVEAFAQEEYRRGREGIRWKGRCRLLGTPDERTLWLKSRYYIAPLYWRAVLYFLYRYIFRLGFLDGQAGFVFHFLQSFWFRLVVDIRLSELLREGRAERAGPGGQNRRAVVP